jgi:Spy/CpxP family protein refolding chaperone
MKIPFLSLFLVGAVMGIPQQMALAQDSTASSQTAPSSGSTVSGATCTSGTGQGQRMERLKSAMSQLDLTDAQKEQIKQIRASVTDRKERRQQIMAVLTPDQKAKLVAMWQAHQNGAGTGAGAASNGNDDP